MHSRFCFFLGLLVGCFIPVTQGQAQGFAIDRVFLGVDDRPRVAHQADCRSYYILMRGWDLDSITEPVAMELGVGEVGELTDPVAAMRLGFYRVIRVSIDLPFDTDADGMEDAFELRYREILDPLNPADASLDSDGDGETNINEYRAGTDPSRAADGPDGLAPALVRVFPPNASVQGPNQITLIVEFSEPMDPETLTADAVRLVASGRPAIPLDPLGTERGPGDRSLRVFFPQLNADTYRWTLNTERLKDVAGNPVSDAPREFSFTVPQASAVWIGQVDGAWTDPANWAGGLVPGPDDHVYISVPEDVTVSHDAGLIRVASLTCDESFILSGGIMDVSSFIVVNNDFLLDGGTLRNATILPGNGGQGLNVSAKAQNQLDSIVLEADLNLLVPEARVRVRNGLTLNGVADLGGLRAHVEFFGDQTLGGTGAVLIGGGGDARTGLWISEAGSTLLIQSAIDIECAGVGGFIGRSVGWLHGPADVRVIHQGRCSVTAGRLLFNVGSFRNEGLMLATDGGIEIDNLTGNQGVIELVGGNLTLSGQWGNGGSITAIDSVVNLGGTFSIGGLCGFERSGGAVNLVGTLLNDARILDLNAVTGDWRIHGGTIRGGTVRTTEDARLSFSNSGNNSLDSVTIHGDLILDSNSARVRIINGLTLNGTVEMSALGAHLQFVGTQTLSGEGLIRFGGGDARKGLWISEPGTTLTIDEGIVVEGGTGFIGRSVGWYWGPENVFLNHQGRITTQAGGKLDFTVGGLVNEGTIEAVEGELNVNWLTGNAGGIEVTRGTLALGGNWTNDGLIRITDTTMRLGGSFARDDVGMVERTGGSVQLIGAMDNRDGILELNEGTGDWEIRGGRILGGTVRTRESARMLFDTSPNNQLDEVIVDGDLILDSNSARVRIINGLTLNGTVEISALGAHLQFVGTQTLSGEGLIRFGGGDARKGLWISEPGTTLTIDEGIVVEGGTGFIGRSVGWYWGPENVLLNHQGRITTQAGGKLDFTVGGLVNEGTIEAVEGELNVNWLTGNAGGIEVTRGTLALGGNWTNDGLIRITDTTMRLGGSFARDDVGMVERTGGSVQLIGAMDNRDGILELNEGTGDWEIRGGRILGGTVRTRESARMLFDTSPNNQLDEVIVDGDLILDSNSARVRIINGLTLNGTVEISALGAHLQFVGTQTLSGEGLIRFGGGDARKGLWISEPGTTLTIDEGIVVEGGTGFIGRSVGWYWGPENISIVNRGQITANSDRFNLFAMDVAGEGIFTVGPGGLLGVSGDFTQAASGRVEIVLGGTSTGQHGRMIAGGIARFGGTLAIAMTDTFSVSSGQVFRIMSFASRENDFSATEGLNQGGIIMETQFEVDHLNLVAP